MSSLPGNPAPATGGSAGRVAAEGMKSNDNGGFNTWFIAQTFVHFWVGEEAG